MTTKERRIQHYSSSQKILLVGEGDFSFAACLARAFGSAVNMIATSLDSEDTLLTKHQNCEENLDDLEERGCVLLHEVDVHDMSKHPTLLGMEFDVIIFNFPHAGHFSWLRETDAILIKRHKKLLRVFFRSASGMLKEDGEVHVTHRDDYPYNEWEVEKQAQKAGLVLKEKVHFVKQNYPGYHNKRGSFIDGNKRFPIEEPFTFKFSLDRRKTTFVGTSTVSGYNHDKRDSAIIQSNKKLALEAEQFFLDHQGTTLAGTSNKNVTLKDFYTSKSSLDHQQTTLAGTSNKIVSLKDFYTSKSSLDHQQTTLAGASNKNVTLKDFYTSKFSLDHQQTTLAGASNKNVTFKDFYTSKFSLDHQQTTLAGASNKNAIPKDPYTSKPLSPYQEMTSTSAAVSNYQMPAVHGNIDRDTNHREETYNIAARDYVDDAITEILAFFQQCAECVFGIVIKLAIATFFILFIVHIFIVLKEGADDL